MEPLNTLTARFSFSLAKDVDFPKDFIAHNYHLVGQSLDLKKAEDEVVLKSLYHIIQVLMASAHPDRYTEAGVPDLLEEYKARYVKPIFPSL